MPQVTTPRGLTFSVDERETVLDAALRCGVGLPYSCRTGRCSTCKGRVLQGRSEPTHDELGLTPEERDAGWVLTCVRKPLTDLALDIEELDTSRVPQPRTLPCKIHSLDRLAPDVLRVLLRFPPATPLPFVAGQYVDVIGPGGVHRSYSLANAERSDKLVELHIRKVPDGEMSQYWFDSAKVNDVLRIRGPLGTFYLRDLQDLDVVFLATGTGIAPIKAMLESLGRDEHAGSPRTVSVYWGGRQPQDIYWQPPEPAPLPLKTFVPVLSRADAAWVGTRGHVQDAFLASSPELGRTIVFACGSDAMIRGAKDQLVRAGLDPHRFHSDAFVCSSSTNTGAIPA